MVLLDFCVSGLDVWTDGTIPRDASWLTGTSFVFYPTLPYIARMACNVTRIWTRTRAHTSPVGTPCTKTRHRFCINAGAQRRPRHPRPPSPPRLRRPRHTSQRRNHQRHSAHQNVLDDHTIYQRTTRPSRLRTSGHKIRSIEEHSKRRRRRRGGRCGRG